MNHCLQDCEAPLRVIKADCPDDSKDDSLSAVALVLSRLPCLEQLMLNQKSVPLAWIVELPLPDDFVVRMANCTRRTILATRLALTALPDKISTCLTTLDVSANQLSILPAGLSRCRALKTLDLSSNKFTDLPLFLGSLPELSCLRAFGNPLHGDIGRLQEVEGVMKTPHMLVHGPVNGPVLRYLQELHRFSVPVRRVQVITLIKWLARRLFWKASKQS